MQNEKLKIARAAKKTSVPKGLDAPAILANWVRTEAGLPEGTVVTVLEEPHCPDPGCPLRRTVLEWTDAAGKKRRAVVVKPLAYVRRGDVERAARRGGLMG